MERRGCRDLPLRVGDGLGVVGAEAGDGSTAEGNQIKNFVCKTLARHWVSLRVRFGEITAHIDRTNEGAPPDGRGRINQIFTAERGGRRAVNG